MKLKTMLLASACSFGITGAAVALDQSTIDAIAADLSAQGFTKMEVKIGPNGAKVEASGPNGEIERYYDSAGTLVKEESADGESSSGSGNSASGFGNDSDDDVYGDDDHNDDDDDDSQDDDEEDDDDDDEDEDDNDD